MSRRLTRRFLVYLDRNGGDYPWFVYDRAIGEDVDSHASLQEAFENARNYSLGRP